MALSRLVEPDLSSDLANSRHAVAVDTNPDLRSSESMTEYRDHHATIFVAPAIAGPIEAARREWDPAMAAQIAAHVKVEYPQEAPISDLLVERVRAASAGFPPFRLRLGHVATFGERRS
jgi:hypothetical protein